MARIEAGAAGDAVALLRSVIHFPFARTVEFKVFLCMSLIAAGQRNEAERELGQVLTESHDECPERKLAHALLARHGLDTHVIDAPQNLTGSLSSAHYRLA